jgi:hypothetical protein
MMKQQSGQWVAPFTFSDAQRKKLMRAWPRKADKNNAESYIASVEPLVEKWLSFVNERKSTIPQLRQHATAIQEAAKAMKDALETPPADVAASIDAHVKELLYSSHCHEYHETVHGLRLLFPDTAYPGAIEISEVLDGWLDLLMKSIAPLVELVGVNSKDKGTEKELVHWLADAFFKHFNELPSGYAGSQFGNFCDALSKVLGWEFGEPTRVKICQLINSIKCP